MKKLLFSLSLITFLTISVSPAAGGNDTVYIEIEKKLLLTRDKLVKWESVCALKSLPDANKNFSIATTRRSGGKGGTESVDALLAGDLKNTISKDEMIKRYNQWLEEPATKKLRNDLESCIATAKEVREELKRFERMIDTNIKLKSMVGSHPGMIVSTAENHVKSLPELQKLQGVMDSIKASYHEPRELELLMVEIGQTSKDAKALNSNSFEEIQKALKKLIKP